MSMNYNAKTPPPVTPKSKKNNTKTIIGLVIIGFITVFGALGLYQYEKDTLNNVGGSTSSVSSDILSGDYDTYLREKCVEKLHSYGLDTVTEGSVNLCVDTAKLLAYNELHK